jgi:ABC-type spermidine/putrescine transport system permease subunit I
MPGRRFVIGVPYVWLIVFFLLPFLILLYISFVDMGKDIHPFKPIWDTADRRPQAQVRELLDIFRAARVAHCSRRSISRPTCARSGMPCGRPSCAC